MAQKKSTKKNTEFEEFRRNKKGRPSKKVEPIVEEEEVVTTKSQKDIVSDEIKLIFAAIAAIIMYLSMFGACGIIGVPITAVIFGMTGVFGYVFPIAFFGIIWYLIKNKKRTLAKSKITLSLIGCVCICSFIHLASIVDECKLFESFSKGYEKMGGGFLGALISTPLYHLCGKLASLLIIGAILIVVASLLTGKALISLFKEKTKSEYVKQSNKIKENKEKRVKAELERKAEEGRRSYESMMNGDNILNKDLMNVDYYRGNVDQKRNESFVERLKRGGAPDKKAPAEFVNDKVVVNSPASTGNTTSVTENKPVVNPETDMMEIFADEEVKTPDKEIYKLELERKFGNKTKESDDIAITDNSILENRDEEFEPVIKGDVDYTNFGANKVTAGKSGSIDVFARGDYKVVSKPENETHSLSGLQTEVKGHSPADDSTGIVIKKANKPPRPYVFPPKNILNRQPAGAKGTSTATLKETAKKLEDVLKSFGVNVTVTNISCGPSVTRYELTPEVGVKVSKITSLADDIKLNLAAADIRIEAPIPGKAAVGIEVPNEKNMMVYFGNLVDSDEFKNSTAKLPFAVGKDIGGQVVVCDLAKMPHVLVAGATGSGKSVCINTIINSIIYKCKPEDCKLILIDPKVVELSVYNGIPHLLIPVVTDPKKASGALNWAVMEMTDRYKKFADLGVRDLEGYNKRIENQKEPEVSSSGEVYERLPKIVVIVDELADLMMVAHNEVEDSICRLAQLARAAGIHLVIATQRPSVDVITGLIKANVPSRVAFAVASQVDSRTILDMAGAEKLLGKGDMLFYPTGYPKPVRVQGAFISDGEVQAIVEHLKSHNDDNYNPEIEEQLKKAQTSSGSQSNDMGGSADSGSDTDELLYRAGLFIIEKEKASIGMLQRQFKIGFNRAARIMDTLSDLGVVGPEEGTKPRQILMNLETYDHFAEANGLK